MRKVRALSLAARPARPGAETVEQSVPGLAEALARVATSPTAASRTRAGDAYREAGILDQAFDQYWRASRADPADAGAWDGMARIWRDWGLPQLALSDASRAVFHAPASGPAHNTLGTILQMLGRRREARAEFERAAALDPGAAWALNNICYSWVSEGDGRSAVGACRSALALAPGLLPARNNLALAWAVEGDMARAAAEFASAGSPSARAFNLGIVYMGQRRFREAAAAFDSAVAMEPGLPLAVERARQARRLAVSTADSENDDGRR